MSLEFARAFKNFKSRICNVKPGDVMEKTFWHNELTTLLCVANDSVVVRFVVIHLVNSEQEFRGQPGREYNLNAHAVPEAIKAGWLRFVF